jgi:hypothetical protein
MAKTGKRRNKFAAQAKRLRTKAPPELIAKLREFEVQAQAYWDGLPKVSDEVRRELDRAMAPQVPRREVQARAPQPQAKSKETASSWVFKAVKLYPKPEPNWTDARYAQHLQLHAPEAWDWRTIANELSKLKPKPPPNRCSGDERCEHRGF